jgi:transcriptional regulator with XRE-family HTH domain
MKLERSKEWYERRIALEGDVEIGAGVPPNFRAKVAEASNVKPLDTRIALGTFVELWRRSRGWDAVKLAQEAGVNPEEVLEIERNPQAEPEPSAVYKLAGIFGLSPKPLLELAGLIEPRTPHLREAAVRFAARSESIAALNQNEREAFEAFVSAISEATQKQR